MNDSFPTNTTLLLRGVTRRCPLCGGGHLFTHWIHFAKRCPKCGFAFEREVGFFTGGWLINFGVTQILLFGLLMLYILQINGAGRNSTRFIVAGFVICVVVPIAFFPFSRTIWAGIELVARKPSAKEAEDARANCAEHVAWHDYVAAD